MLMLQRDAQCLSLLSVSEYMCEAVSRSVIKKIHLY